MWRSGLLRLILAQNVSRTTTFRHSDNAPCVANNSIIMTPIPRPLSALHSISTFPATKPPATTIRSAKVIETLTLEWWGEAFIGSGIGIGCNDAMAMIGRPFLPSLSTLRMKWSSSSTVDVLCRLGLSRKFYCNNKCALKQDFR